MKYIFWIILMNLISCSYISNRDHDIDISKKGFTVCNNYYIKIYENKLMDVANRITVIKNNDFMEVYVSDESRIDEFNPYGYIIYSCAVALDEYNNYKVYGLMDEHSDEYVKDYLKLNEISKKIYSSNSKPYEIIFIKKGIDFIFYRKNPLSL